MPKKKKHPEYAALSKPTRKIVKKFAALLRLAESLDRSHRGSVTALKLKQGEQKQVVLVVHAKQDIQLEIWGAQGHRKAFRKAFNRDLVLEPVIETDEAGQSPAPLAIARLPEEE